MGKSENIQKYVDIEAKANYDALTTALNKQSFKELVVIPMKLYITEPTKPFMNQKHGAKMWQPFILTHWGKTSTPLLSYRLLSLLEKGGSFL